MKPTLLKLRKLAPLTVMILGGVIALLGINHASADNTIGEYNAQKAMLELRIEQTSAEYQKVSEEKASAQESCNIAIQKGEQLKQLAELNGARRDEIKAIDQKLSTLQSNLELSQ